MFILILLKKLNYGEKHYEADIDWSHNRRNYKLIEEKDGKDIDISKEVDWL